MRYLLALMFLSSTLAAQSREGRIDVGDATIHYAEAGSGAAVVFIHGLANTMSTWSDQFPAFARSFRTIVYDRRGNGRSTGRPDQTADPADLAVMLDSLGIARAHLVGHSAGARTALQFALAYPDRVDGLVLYGAGPPDGFPGNDERGGREMLKQLARQHGLDSLKRFLAALPMFWMPPEKREATRARVDKLWAEYSGRDLLADDPESGRVPVPRFDQMSGLRPRTLVLLGERDGSYQHAFADSLVRRKADAVKQVVPGAAHVVHWAQPELFNKAVMDFLARP
jgi:3-oxoadipate enol-lactonase